MPSVSAWLTDSDYDNLRYRCAIDCRLNCRLIEDVRIVEIEQTQLRTHEQRDWVDIELPAAEEKEVLASLKWRWEFQHTDELYQIVDDAIYAEACNGAGP